MDDTQIAKVAKLVGHALTECDPVLLNILAALLHAQAETAAHMTALDKHTSRGKLQR
jgi:N-acetylglucosamine kinase-like BadF-type ATPase